MILRESAEGQILYCLISLALGGSRESTKCSYREGLIRHPQLYLESWSDFSFAVGAQAWNQLPRWCQPQFWYHFNAEGLGGGRRVGVGGGQFLNGRDLRTRYRRKAVGFVFSASFSGWPLSSNTDVAKCVIVIFLWHISKAVRGINHIAVTVWV